MKMLGVSINYLLLISYLTLLIRNSHAFSSSFPYSPVLNGSGHRSNLPKECSTIETNTKCTFFSRPSSKLIKSFIALHQRVSIIDDGSTTSQSLSDDLNLKYDFSIPDINDLSTGSDDSPTPVYDIDIDEYTQTFLNITDSNPLGSLSLDVVDKAKYVIEAWTKTFSTEGAEIVERILTRLEDDKKMGNNKVVLTCKLYLMACDAWVKSGAVEAPARAEMILRKMETMYTSNQDNGANPMFRPNAIPYNVVINSYSKQIQTSNRQTTLATSFSGEKQPGNKSFSDDAAKKIALKVESILIHMKQFSSQTNNTDTLPNKITYNNVISTYAKCGMARKAEELLNDMLQIGTIDTRPDLITYNSLIDAWSRTSEQGAAERAESILNMMEEIHKKENDSNSINLKPDAFSYTGVIFAYSRSNQVGSADKAEAILNRMENSDLPIDAFVYNAVLDAHAKCRTEDGARKAEALLTKMEGLGIANSVSYNTVINALAKSKTTNSSISIGRAAEAILARMEKSDIKEVKPDVITYTTVIDAITRSGEEMSPQRAQAIVDKMFDLMDKGDLDVEPNIVTMNTVLYSWAASKEKNAAREAEQLLEKMEAMYESGRYPKIRPNTISYTTVIDAYAKSNTRDAAINAETIFKRMETQYANNNMSAKPNVHSFNTVINAWVKSRMPGNVVRAEQILMKMMDLHKAGNDDAKPNVVSFTTVIHGWAKSKEEGSAERAEKIFKMMQKEYENGNESAKPNAFSYCSLIDAWSNEKRKGSVERAEQIFLTLIDSYLSGSTDVKPTAMQATQIIDAWSKSGLVQAGERAELLLDKLDDLYIKYKDKEMKPNALTYTTVINSWAKARRFGKARSAQNVLKRMIKAKSDGNIDAAPNVFAFTAVLNACAFTVGDILETKEALKIASETFKQLSGSEYGRPNHVTYATFLRVCINLIPKGESQASAVESVFRKCCEDGQVSELVLRLATSALSKEQIKRLGISSIEKIPNKWKDRINV